jgi:hypothetical protein
VYVITIPHILDQSRVGEMQEVQLTITSYQASGDVLASSQVVSQFLPTDTEPRGSAYEFYFNPPLRIEKDRLYNMKLSVAEDGQTLFLEGSPMLTMVTDGGMQLKNPLPRVQQSVRPDQPYTMNIQIVESGLITSVILPYLVDHAGLDGEKALQVELQLPTEGGGTSVDRIHSSFFPAEDDVRGESYEVALDEPLRVEAGSTLLVSLTTESEGVQLVPRAPAPVHESSWDDAIPYPVDGFSPYSESGGIYRGDLNFEMYWPDDQNKLERFETTLDLADYIFITSNRQWGTTTRVPERYLLTTFYYQPFRLPSGGRNSVVLQRS